MRDNILAVLEVLREYARERTASRDCAVILTYQHEESSLMRFANSAVSLNSCEQLIRLKITAVEGRRRAGSSLITDLGAPEEMKHAVAEVVDMVDHAQPLTYKPNVPALSETHINEQYWDETLAAVTNAEKLAYFNTVVDGLETSDLTLSGIFSSGMNILAMTNTLSDHALFFKTSDAQVSAVLAHEKLKWEIIAEQSAQQVNDLDPAPLHRKLGFLKQLYENEKPCRLDPGCYDIVFGPAAIAALVEVMNWIVFDGGLMKRGFSFLDEEKIGKKVFSPKFSVMDDPGRRETFPLDRDMTGMARKPFALIDEGRFCGYTWSQDDADEFDRTPTGHTVPHTSLSVAGGDNPVDSLEGLAGRSREKEILYIPFLHYMNVVNPSKGIITASSRFGALLLKKDGDIALPFNVRLTRSLADIFGDKLEWLTRATVAYNTSGSYGARNPTAIVVPKFMKVNDLEISHSNSSF
jgi:predicted Zn-dependent protease